MEDDCKEQEVVKVVIHDVEEGEISDSASVEEISEESFNTKQTPLPSPPAASAITVNSNNSNAKNNSSSGGGSGTGTRVWTMRDVYKYQISSRTSYSGLYNLAWAQAVNNKPLDEVFVMMEDNNSKDNKNGSNNDVSNVSNPNGNEESKVVIDVEEGELEEGEIDLDSDVIVADEGFNMEIEDANNEVLDLRKQFDSIKKELTSLNLIDAEKSFDRICSNLKKLADSLKKLVVESSSSERYSLVQLLLTALQSVNSVFSSMDQRPKEQNRDVVLRLLVHIISLKPPLFSSQQLKEMEVIMSSVDSLADPLCKDNNNKKKQLREGCNKVDSKNMESKKGETELWATGSLDLTEQSFSLEYSKSGLVNPKHKGVALPLLDLHKDHDADSLPSPTRELSEPLPFDKGFVLGHGLVKPEWPVPRRTLGRGNSVMHPYETDAVKAVSSYQQKFNRSSFYTNNELPSPTPSEEADTGDCEMSEEVSSSVIHKASSSVNTSSLGQPIVSSVNSSILGQSAVSYTAGMAIGGQGFSKSGIVSSASNNPNLVVKSSSAKSRDPRLRLANSDAGSRNLNHGPSAIENNVPRLDPIGTTSSHKKNTVEKQVLDGPAPKRQRNESTDSGFLYDVQAITGIGGSLEDRGTAGIPVTNSYLTQGSVFNGSRNLASNTTNLTTHGNEKFQIVGQNTTLPVSSLTTNLPLSGTASTSPVMTPATTLSVNSSFTLPITSQSANLPMKDSSSTASLHSLLKDIAVNPSIWMNILKMEHQRSSSNNRSMTQASDSNTLLGAVPSTNGAPYNSSMLGHLSAAIAQTPPPPVSVVGTCTCSLLLLFSFNSKTCLDAFLVALGRVVF
ncbi:hypothetical protein RD792_017934 [Penstemon davidsonii]|uniref:CPL3 ARM repeat domain-containing protein n=1 Tax=Penstemon davidsonii TaxID=160366 RepID=A0ABR0DVJ8_9LAMI|nr:hypothetical protein RD792_017934 [Penstemon davidsonii]